MKLMQTTPTFGTMKQDFDRVFERFFEPTFWPLGKPRTLESMWEPTLDLSETEKEFVIRLEAPAMARRASLPHPKPTSTATIAVFPTAARASRMKSHWLSRPLVPTSCRTTSRSWLPSSVLCLLTPSSVNQPTVVSLS